MENIFVQNWEMYLWWFSTLYVGKLIPSGYLMLPVIMKTILHLVKKMMIHPSFHNAKERGSCIYKDIVLANNIIWIYMMPLYISTHNNINKMINMIITENNETKKLWINTRYLVENCINYHFIWTVNNLTGSSWATCIF